MTRRRLRETLLHGAAYTGFFCLAFAFCAYLTFPYDRLKDHLAARVGGARGSDALELQIGALSPSWLTGVSLRDVKLTRAASGDDAAATLRFDAVSLRASLLSLLFGDVAVKATAEAGDGELVARFEDDGDQRQIEAELDDLDLGALGLGSWLGLPIAGSASGDVRLTLPADPSRATGEIKLTVAGARFGDGKAKIKAPGMSDGLTLDEIDAGKLELAMTIKDGVAHLDRFASDGPDLKVKGSGSARLADPLRRTRLDVDLELGFTEAYKNKSPRTKSLFDLLELRDDFRRAKGPDGALRLSVGGSVQSLRTGPAGSLGAASARAARGKRARGGRATADAEQ